MTTNGNYAIQTKSIDCYYGSYRAVHDVSLNIAMKKITAFIGPSDRKSVV